MDFSALVRWIKENTGDRAAVSMDYTLAGLQQLEEFLKALCRPGLVRSVSTEMDAALQDMKSRMIPVIRTMEDHTKIEYLGYENILFMPDFTKYTRKQILDFIRMNKPCAVAIPANRAAAEFHSF